MADLQLETIMEVRQVDDNCSGTFDTDCDLMR